MGCAGLVYACGSVAVVVRGRAWLSRGQLVVMSDKRLDGSLTPASVVLGRYDSLQVDIIMRRSCIHFATLHGWWWRSMLTMATSLARLGYCQGRMM